MRQNEIDMLLHYMPHVIRSADLSDWERSFCASIIHKSRRPGFKCSVKQAQIMERLVREFKASHLKDTGDAA